MESISFSDSESSEEETKVDISQTPEWVIRILEGTFRSLEVKQRIYKIFNLQSQNKTIQYQDIVLEYSPVKSRFITKGGYIIPDGGYIIRELKIKIYHFRQEFGR